MGRRSERISLLVSGLHSVAEFNAEDMIATPIGLDSNGCLVKKIIKANHGKLLIQAIDLDYLANMLKNPYTVVDIESALEQEKLATTERRVA